MWRALVGKTQRSLAGQLRCVRRLHSDDHKNAGNKTALVLGSSGAFGSVVSRYLSRDLGMAVIGADVVELPSDFNSSDWELDGFITLPRMTQSPSVADVSTELALGLNTILGEEDEIDTIVCASVRVFFLSANCTSLPGSQSDVAL